jgi:hypothetical protein
MDGACVIGRRRGAIGAVEKTTLCCQRRLKSCQNRHLSAIMAVIARNAINPGVSRRRPILRAARIPNDAGEAVLGSRPALAGKAVHWPASGPMAIAARRPRMWVA